MYDRRALGVELGRTGEGNGELLEILCKRASQPAGEQGQKAYRTWVPVGAELLGERRGKGRAVIALKRVLRRQKEREGRPGIRRRERPPWMKADRKSTRLN